MPVAAPHLPMFPGFPDFRSNVTFVPLQFFTAVLPHRSRGCVRLTGYMLRQLLGYVDADGNLIREKIHFTYADLIDGVGISRGGIAKALREAIDFRLIRALDGTSSKAGTTFTLNWSDHYTNCPKDFRGFFRPEAIVLGDASDAKQPAVAKAARKNIPNAFFDRVLRSERLSVSRVVGTLLFRSIRWGPAGERKAPVNISISELSRLTNLSRQKVHEALHEAIRCGYIERVSEGLFDLSAGDQSRAAVYRIRWISDPTSAPEDVPDPIKPDKGSPFTLLNQAKSVNGGEVQESERQPSKMMNDISLKTESIKTNTTATTVGQPSGETSAPAAVDAAGLVKALTDVGIDHKTASRIVREFPADQIERQLQWLPLRRVRENPAGLLRRAIEGNWKQPGVVTCTPAQVLVAHFEATVHGLSEPMFPASNFPQPEAEALLVQLGVPAAGAEIAAEWGRRFGKFVLRHRPGKTHFAWCARDCGPEFVRAAKQTDERAKLRLAAARQEALRKERQDLYEQHLVSLARQFRVEKPKLWEEFLAEQERLMSQFALTPLGRQAMQSEVGQAIAFAEFARDRGEAVPRPEEWR